nr:unnamed protein product [Callosobruchus chinensis]
MALLEEWPRLEIPCSLGLLRIPCGSPSAQFIFRDGQAALEAVNKTKGKLRVMLFILYDQTLITIVSDSGLRSHDGFEDSKLEVKSQQPNESNAPPSRPPPPPSKSASQSPRRAPPPKAGVISIPSAAVRRQPPLTLASTVNSTAQQQNNDSSPTECVYEEIDGDEPEFAGGCMPDIPPPPPPRPDVGPTAPPPVPARSAPPPPLPARPRQ